MKITEKQEEKILEFQTEEALQEFIKTERIDVGAALKELEPEALGQAAGGMEIRIPGNYEMTCALCGKVIKGPTQGLLRKAKYYHLLYEHGEKKGS